METYAQRSPLLISADASALVVVDAQDMLLDLIPHAALLRWNLQRLAEGATLLKVPCLATEQYPEKLGPTSDTLQPHLTGADGATSIPGKLSFSCVGCEPFWDRLQAILPRQVVLAGIETHVCILQSALDLVSAGYEVFLVVDALGSRFSIDHETALRRAELAGATLTTVEAVLFEWCGRAGTADFKQISKIVRRPRPENSSSTEPAATAE